MIQMQGMTMDRAANGPARLPMTPGRRAALAVGVPLCLLLTVTVGYSLVTNLGRGKLAVYYPIPVSAERVNVSLDGGDVHLRQVAGRQGSLTGTGYYGLVRPRITERLDAGTAIFGYDCQPVFGNCGLNATLSVPPGTLSSLSTGGGDVTADGITGRLFLSTGGGDVTADQVTGDLTLSTDGGDISARGVAAASVIAQTGGGDVTIVFTRAPREVQVSTDGGDITIVVPSGATEYHVTAHTDGGNVTDQVPINTHSPNVITATSGGGDITISQAG